MRERLELAAVLAAIVLHFALTRWVGVRGLDVVPLTLCVLAYVLVRGRDAEARAAWGTRRAGFGRCLRAALPLYAFGLAVCFCIGWHRGFVAIDWHLVVTVLLYPLWGIAQQFLLLGLMAHNLDRLGAPRAAVLTTATLGFAAVHLPNWPLTGATLVLGAWCAVLFFRHRNLWPLGIAHGVLGALFYRWVLGVDVVEKMFTQR